MQVANLENDAYFLRLVKEKYFDVQKDGTITNLKTKYVIGSKQKGTDYIGVRHQDEHKVMRNIQAHRLVWLVHGGSIFDPALVVNHKDLNKRNNAISNLELITELANRQHALPYRNEPKGSERPNAKFTDAEVLQYRKLWQAKAITLKQICEHHNVSKNTAFHMVHSKTYKHI